MCTRRCPRDLQSWASGWPWKAGRGREGGPCQGPTGEMPASFTLPSLQHDACERHAIQRAHVKHLHHRTAYCCKISLRFTAAPSSCLASYPKMEREALGTDPRWREGPCARGARPSQATSCFPDERNPVKHAGGCTAGLGRRLPPAPEVARLPAFPYFPFRCFLYTRVRGFLFPNCSQTAAAAGCLAEGDITSMRRGSGIRGNHDLNAQYP